MGKQPELKLLMCWLIKIRSRIFADFGGVFSGFSLDEYFFIFYCVVAWVNLMRILTLSGFLFGACRVPALD